jgi:hypothetical protein
MPKCKYCTINKKGEPEAWSGMFNDTKEALQWHRRYGVIAEAKGHKLVLVESKNDEEIE